MMFYEKFVATNISDCLGYLFFSGGSLSFPHNTSIRMFESGQVFGCFLFDEI